MERMVIIMENKLRVWWIPQVGAISEAFYVPVQSVAEGKKVLDMLAAYDAFQLQNRVKPDYCNVGGLQMFDEEECEWNDWYMETDEDYFDDVDDALIEGLSQNQDFFSLLLNNEEVKKTGAWNIYKRDI